MISHHAPQKRLSKMDLIFYSLSVFNVYALKYVSPTSSSCIIINQELQECFHRMLLYHNPKVMLPSHSPPQTWASAITHKHNHQHIPPPFSTALILNNESLPYAISMNPQTFFPNVFQIQDPFHSPQPCSLTAHSYLVIKIPNHERQLCFSVILPLLWSPNILDNNSAYKSFLLCPTTMIIC